MRLILNNKAKKIISMVNHPLKKSYSSNTIVQDKYKTNPVLKGTLFCNKRHYLKFVLVLRF